MEEKIFNFINDEDYHSECEDGGAGISVETLHAFFNTIFGHRTDDEIKEFFKLK
jgi:hypothetical protein